MRWLLPIALVLLLSSCRPTRSPVAETARLRIEIVDAGSGKRLAALETHSTDDPIEQLSHRFAVVLRAEPSGRDRYVAFQGERRGERWWIRTVVTRIDDDDTLRTIFELAMMERQLALCASGPCPKGLDQKAIDAREATLSRVHSLGSLPLSGPFVWKASTPDGTELLLRASLH